jgi:hypothetical protein
MMIYPHRNGESDPPSKEETGWYWFNSNNPTGGAGMFLMTDGRLYGYGVDGRAKVGKLNGRWWGPVIPPWQEEATP